MGRHGRISAFEYEDIKTRWPQYARLGQAVEARVYPRIVELHGHVVDFHPQFVLCDVFFNNWATDIDKSMRPEAVDQLGKYIFAAGVTLHELFHATNYPKCKSIRSPSKPRYLTAWFLVKT